MSGNRAVVGFAKIDKPVLVQQTVIHLSPEAYDFISRHNDLGPRTERLGWQAKKVKFSLLSSLNITVTEFHIDGDQSRLYLGRDHFRGKRVVLEEVLIGDKMTEQHRADLEVALRELADAVRAETTGFGLDLQTF